MKKIMLVIFLLVLTFIFYFLFSTTKSKTLYRVVPQKVEAIYKYERDEFPFLEDSEEDFEENLSLLDMDMVLLEEELPKEIIPEMIDEGVIDIMVEITMDEIEKKFPPKEGITPVTAIELPKNSIANLNVGDTISLPYMGTDQFDAKIISKTTNKSGSITVIGNLLDSDNQYSVLLTEGKKMSFGTLNTPNGSYEIEVKNGQGYVYSTDEIDNQWIDYTREDTLISHDFSVP